MTAHLTDSSGTVIAGYGYDVFGATRSESGTGDADEPRLRPEVKR